MAKDADERGARALVFQLSTVKFYRIPLDGLDQFAVNDDELEDLLESRSQAVQAQPTTPAYVTQLHAPMAPYPGSVARVGPFAGSVARVGPFANSMARVGPFANSVARVGPFAGSVARVGPFAGSVARVGPLVGGVDVASAGSGPFVIGSWLTH